MYFACREQATSALLCTRVRGAKRKCLPIAVLIIKPRIFLHDVAAGRQAASVRWWRGVLLMVFLFIGEDTSNTAGRQRRVMTHVYQIVESKAATENNANGYYFHNEIFNRPGYRDRILAENVIDDRMRGAFVDGATRAIIQVLIMTDMIFEAVTFTILPYRQYAHLCGPGEKAGRKYYCYHTHCEYRRAAGIANGISTFMARPSAGVTLLRQTGSR